MSVACLLLLLGLGAANAGPFFPRELLEPEPVYAAASADPGPYGNYEVPPGQAFHFDFRLPQLDLSQIFKPLRLFAGVNLPLVVQEVEEEERDCDIGKFDLSEEENEAIEHCQEEETEAEDEFAFKECVLSELPESSLELREFLDREEFDLASLSSSYSLSLVGGNFGQKRTVTFRMCPMDELNRIDEEASPEQTVDRVDAPVRRPAVPLAQVVPVAPLVPTQLVQPVQPAGPESEEETPGFQLNIPQLEFPDFGGFFNSFESMFSGLLGNEEAEGVPANFGSGTPFTDFFSMLFPVSGPNTDMSDCDSMKFDVSSEAYETAKECKHADEYRECLRSNVTEDEDHAAFLEFATDEEYQIVASSFAKSTFIHLDETTVKNSIYLRRCRIIEPETEEQSAETETDADSETEPEVIEEEPLVEVQSAAENVPTVPEAPEDPVPLDAEPEVEEETRESAETVPEEPSVVPETAPEASDEEYAPAEDVSEEEEPAEAADIPEEIATSEENLEEWLDAAEGPEGEYAPAKVSEEEGPAAAADIPEETATSEETPEASPDAAEGPEEEYAPAEVSEEEPVAPADIPEETASPEEEYAPVEVSEEEPVAPAEVSEEDPVAPADIPEETATSEETPEASPDVAEAPEEDSGDVEEAGEGDSAAVEETAEEHATVEEAPKEDPAAAVEAPEEFADAAEVIPESAYGTAAEESNDNNKDVESIKADGPREIIDADEEP